MLKKLLVLMLSLVLISTFVVGCSGKTSSTGGGSEEPIRLKMSVTASDSSTWAKGAEKFAELVKERTNGQILISVYPNEQLSGGNQSKGVEMLSSGATDLSFHSNIIYSVLDERFGVISLPWLIPNHEAVDKALAGEGGEAINKILDEIGIVGLAFGENGFRQLTNNVREIKTVEDMKGLKIRVPGMKMYIDLFTALGADPISMNFAEVFTALQTGSIDGQENPIDTIKTSNIHEVQKYLSIWNYSYDAIILGMNKEKFESLTEEQQKILREAAVEACEYQKQLTRELEAEQLKEFEEAGVKITEVTDEAIEGFKEKVQVVYEQYEPIMGKELIDAFRQ